MNAFVSAMLPWMIAIHVVSMCVLIFILALFGRLQGRRKHLMQTLAVTADDDEAALGQWKKVERYQRNLRFRYTVSTVTIAIVSTVLFASFPHWL